MKLWQRIKNHFTNYQQPGGPSWFDDQLKRDQEDHKLVGRDALKPEYRKQFGFDE